MSAVNGGLSFTVGLAREQHPLRSYSGDEFFFDTTGEDASGFSAALFDGTPFRVTSVRINAWNKEGSARSHVVSSCGEQVHRQLVDGRAGGGAGPAH